MSLKELQFKEFLELNQIPKDKLKFAVIVAKHKGKFVFVKNKKRSSWEIPGGKREPREYINFAAKRELQEETGAEKFSIKPVAEYGISKPGNDTYYGRLFYAEIHEFGQLPDSEIDKVELFDESPDDLTYPLIHSHLTNKVEEFLNKSQLKQ